MNIFGIELEANDNDQWSGRFHDRSPFLIVSKRYGVCSLTVYGDNTTHTARTSAAATEEIESTWLASAQFEAPMLCREVLALSSARRAA